MEEVTLTETETRYYGDLYLCCDEEKSGKIPMLKATELFRSANVSNDKILEVISLCGIPSTVLHVSRVQFYSCLKLIAAHQANIPLRQELIAASVQLPLPRFTWTDNSISYSENTIHHNTVPAPTTSTTDRSNSLQCAAEWSENNTSSSRNSSTNHQQLKAENVTVNSDVPSTDSEVEQCESSCDAEGEIKGSGVGGVSTRSTRQRRSVGGGDVGVGAASPEAWSTNSDSPTPTNSVAERPWVKETLWHGLLGDEHRQLLGTEEESSDRHSSEEEENETDLEAVYQITPEQRDYYYKQFKTVQHDTNGLLSGHVARVFFEKSRIPVEELRHIWQLCDVTRDGALSLCEFIAAMHLVVLRRNNILLPATLPTCLHPNILQHGSLALSQQLITSNQEPPEADLLHLDDDDDEDKTDNTVIGSTASIGGSSNASNSRIFSEKNIMSMSTLSTSSQTSVSSRQSINASSNVSTLQPYAPSSPTLKSQRSISNSPKAAEMINITPPPPPPPSLTNIATTALVNSKDRKLWTTETQPSQWTKFTESPTSNVCSPGPKPLNFDMQRTAQAVVSDPQILHPVPLRVTPVGGVVNTSSSVTAVADKSNTELVDGSVICEAHSPKSTVATLANINNNNINNNNSNSASATLLYRDTTQINDLRAIQRPQAKKLPSKNIGALPPPPQREQSIGNSTAATITTSTINELDGGGNSNGFIQSTAQLAAAIHLNKKEAPPLPPPRPHRHGRSSSLDLNKFKITAQGNQASEITAQASFELQTSIGFADFAHFPDTGDSVGSNIDLKENLQQQLHSLPTQSMRTISAVATAMQPLTRQSLQSNQRVSAFEVYRKPNTPRNSQSPAPTTVPTAATMVSQAQAHAPAPFGSAAAAAMTTGLPNAEWYEKRVNAISETLRYVSFKQNNNNANNNMTDILRHLREQNNLLMRLCNDLSDELLTVQARKEEMRLKLEALGALPTAIAQDVALNLSLLPTVSGGGSQLQGNSIRTGSSISAPVTANVTGGSGSSGVHSNV